MMIFLSRYECMEGYSTTTNVADTYVARYTCQWDETWDIDGTVGTDPCASKSKPRFLL